MFNEFEITQLAKSKQAETANKAKNAWMYFSVQKNDTPKSISSTQQINLECCQCS